MGLKSINDLISNQIKRTNSDGIISNNHDDLCHQCIKRHPKIFQYATCYGKIFFNCTFQTKKNLFKDEQQKENRIIL
ncbi:hypothetical protein BpHYR1_049242 [Brachionus plicatilis]|uniref:Uncharacterized protein n=1 Tax=Brachionus plicatilis TaxID=10195 RepID=A0A3M7QN84_BRAPC|nr:hypothetical protein BpHYR1_049242 [Brachionus plicatilis]